MRKILLATVAAFGLMTATAQAKGDPVAALAFTFKFCPQIEFSEAERLAFYAMMVMRNGGRDDLDEINLRTTIMAVSRRSELAEDKIPVDLACFVMQQSLDDVRARMN